MIDFYKVNSIISYKTGETQYYTFTNEEINMFMAGIFFVDGQNAYDLIQPVLPQMIGNWENYSNGQNTRIKITETHYGDYPYVIVSSDRGISILLHIYTPDRVVAREISNVYDDIKIIDVPYDRYTDEKTKNIGCI